MKLLVIIIHKMKDEGFMKLLVIIKHMIKDS